jgi:hypothetical protein
MGKHYQTLTFQKVDRKFLFSVGRFMLFFPQRDFDVHAQRGKGAFSPLKCFFMGTCFLAAAAKTGVFLSVVNPSIFSSYVLKFP